VARVLQAAESPGRGSDPAVAARKIVTAARPRTRYPAGRGAGTIVRARKLLPDLPLDAIIIRTFR